MECAANIAVKDLADQIIKSWTERGYRLEPLVNMALYAGVIDMTPGCDRQISKAMQNLKKRGRARYRPRYKKWENLDITYDRICAAAKNTPATGED